MDGQRVTIRGVVIPADWSRDGRVVAARVAARDEIEYWVENDEKGHKLLKLLHKDVEVSGEVREGSRGKTISVKEVRLKRASARRTTHQAQTTKTKGDSGYDETGRGELRRF